MMENHVPKMKGPWLQMLLSRITATCSRVSSSRSVSSTASTCLALVSSWTSASTCPADRTRSSKEKWHRNWRTILMRRRMSHSGLWWLNSNLAWWCSSSQAWWCSSSQAWSSFQAWCNSLWCNNQAWCSSSLAASCRHRCSISSSRFKHCEHLSTKDGNFNVSHVMRLNSQFGFQTKFKNYFFFVTL